MKLTVAAFLLAAPAVAARRPNGKIHRGTKAVRPNQRMMRNAKHISGPKIRQLDQNNQNQQQQEERDNTWMWEYSIQFTSCHSATTLRQEGGGQDEGPLIANNSIEFSLCPTKGGSNCATYLAPMMDFLNAYTEAQMEEEEYECEIARETCEYQWQMQQNQNGNQNNNGQNNEQYYYNECVTAAGKDYCVEYEGQEDFEVQRYLECAEFEGNGDYVNYFIGPYCANGGTEVRLGMFQDGGCAVPATDGLATYSKYSYGRELPYSKESLVSPYKTISCQQVDQDANNQNNNNGNNNNYNYNQDIQINEFCEEMIQLSAACEKGLNKESSYYWSANNMGCDYIQKTLPLLDAATFSASGGSSGAAKAFAWIFALTTVGLGGYVFYLHKNKDRKVDLSAQGDSTSA
jgi:hypothetical protein